MPVSIYKLVIIEFVMDEKSAFLNDSINELTSSTHPAAIPSPSQLGNFTAKVPCFRVITPSSGSLDVPELMKTLLPYSN